MQSVETYTAQIFVGLRPGYEGEPYPASKAEEICQAHVNKGGLCVSVTPTRFLYRNGAEDGIMVGLINYPRFPMTPEEIKAAALELAEKLRVGLGQIRISVVFPRETFLLGEV